MTIYHKHHIVPRHMGGTDDPSNLVVLTVSEHAEAHRLLYEEHGKEEDKIAWMGLSGIMKREEIVAELYRLGRKKANDILFERHGENWNSIILLGNKSFTGKRHTEETKHKMRKTKNVGEFNSQFGTMWITDGSENKKIKSIDLIPEGWYKGRVIR